MRGYRADYIDQVSISFPELSVRVGRLATSPKLDITSPGKSSKTTVLLATCISTTQYETNYSRQSISGSCYSYTYFST